MRAWESWGMLLPSELQMQFLSDATLFLLLLFLASGSAEIQWITSADVAAGTQACVPSEDEPATTSATGPADRPQI